MTLAQKNVIHRRATWVLCLMAVIIIQGLINILWRLDDVHRCSVQNDRLGDLSLQSFKSRRDENAYNSRFDTISGVNARAFDPWPGSLPLPCFQAEPNWPQTEIQRSPSKEGFLFLREMKTGSSSAVGINLRISRNVARRFFPQFKICKLRTDHATASRMEYGKRDKAKSFLWTIIRDPTKRAISQFFHFQVSRQKTEPTDKNFKEWIGKDSFINQYYIRTLSMEPQFVDTVQYDPIAAANQIMSDYNFIGVTERMDESAVALQLLLGLTTGDILFLNSKGSGGFDDGATPRGCVYIVPSYVSPGMKEYFASREWERIALADTMLHRAANRSLDLTIEKLGRQRFNRALTKFRDAMKVVRERCLPTVQFPCTSSGEPIAQPNCFWGDSGCGTACLDELANELNFYS